MSHDTYMEFCDRKLAEGRRQIVGTARVLVERAEPELYERLADADDGLFLEPLLFAYLANVAPALPMPQLIVGHLPVAERPEALEVRTDGAGLLHLPNVGYFRTSHPEADLVLRLCDEPLACELRAADGAAVPFEFQSPIELPGTAIEIPRHPSALLAPFFSSDGRATVSFADAPVAHAEQIARAFHLIEAVDPTLGAQMRETVRQLVVFREPRANSFAAMGVHGAAFFCAGPEAEEVFFVDDILHQCGHVIFNTMSARRSDFLSIDPETRIDASSGAAADQRTVYGALHGLFGEYHMCRVMRALDEAKVFEGRAAHELVGRLAFMAQKYLRDTTTLDRDMYAADGRYCFEELRNGGRQLRSERPDLWAIDLSEQPYVFDYELFARQAPR